MGLFDFLSSNKKASLPQNKNKELVKLSEEYDDLKRETEAIKAKNKAWQIDFDKIISLRQKAQQFEKENKLNEALITYLESIEKGENSKYLNILNYAFDIDRVIVLYSKTRQKEVLIEFLEEKIIKYHDFRGVKEWAVRLSKLKSDPQIKHTTISPEDIVTQKASNPTLGEKLDEFKKNMPEFNFYFDMPEGSDTLTYNHKVPFELFKKLGEYREAFERIKSLAKIAENAGEFKKAIEAFEKLIIEEYEGAEPFERLIIIYSKLKWKVKEKDTIEHAISFFTQLKEKQLKYVITIAQKYGMEEKAMEYVNQDKKIFYYGGAFELYNPQTNRLKTWNERLRKLS
jgi:tetratricopeptide (TPR) repeat protein